MTATLEMTQHHHATQMTDMKAVGSRVNTEISRCHTLLKQFVCTGIIVWTMPRQVSSSIKSIYLYCI